MVINEEFIKKKIEKEIENFEKKVTHKAIITFSKGNGFIGVGILKTPENHFDKKGINTVLLRQYAINKKYGGYEFRCAMTEGEAEGIKLGLEAILRDFKEEKSKANLKSFFFLFFLFFSNFGNRIKQK